MGRQPRLVAAVFTSLASPDPAAVECQQQMTGLMDGIIIRAIGEPQPPDHVERARMIGHVWYSALVGWVNGWSDITRVHDELAVAVGLLLPTASCRGATTREELRAARRRRSDAPGRRSNAIERRAAGPAASCGRDRRMVECASDRLESRRGARHARCGIPRDRRGESSSSDDLEVGTPVPVRSGSRSRPPACATPTCPP